MKSAKELLQDFVPLTMEQIKEQGGIQYNKEDFYIGGICKTQLFFKKTNEPFTGLLYEALSSEYLKKYSYYEIGYPIEESCTFYENGKIKELGLFDRPFPFWYTYKFFEDGNPQEEAVHKYKFLMVQLIWDHSGECIHNYSLSDKKTLQYIKTRDRYREENPNKSYKTGAVLLSLKLKERRSFFPLSEQQVFSEGFCYNDEFWDIPGGFSMAEELLCFGPEEKRFTGIAYTTYPENGKLKDYRYYKDGEIVKQTASFYESGHLNEISLTTDSLPRLFYKYEFYENGEWKAEHIRINNTWMMRKEWAEDGSLTILSEENDPKQLHYIEEMGEYLKRCGYGTESDFEKENASEIKTKTQESWILEKE